MRHDHVLEELLLSVKHEQTNLAFKTLVVVVVVVVIGVARRGG